MLHKKDSVERIQGSLIQHGHHNNRIYLMQLNTDPPDTLIPVLDDLARENGYGKIFAKIPAPIWCHFKSAGYETEAVIPGFFRGEIDAFFIAKYFSSKKESPPKDSHAPGKPNGTRHPLKTPLGRTIDAPQPIEACGLADAEEMSVVYRQVFQSYPFPIHAPEFLARMMKKGNLYYCIRADDGIAALAAAEIDRPQQVVEMTDFATLPQWRGCGFAAKLLRHMQHRVRCLGIKTAFSIARAASRGMNSVFEGCGYRYAGLLKKNSQICGNIQSMTVWYKDL